VLLQLGPGEVSAPVRVGDQLVVAKLLGRQESELPTFEEARAELNETVYLDKMNKARRRWLDVLRKRANVEIRL
jgi:parvulin-like peptidyl-prolyl isomerase